MTDEIFSKLFFFLHFVGNPEHQHHLSQYPKNKFMFTSFKKYTFLVITEEVYFALTVCHKGHQYISPSNKPNNSSDWSGSHVPPAQVATVS